MVKTSILGAVLGFAGGIGVGWFIGSSQGISNVLPSDFKVKAARLRFYDGVVAVNLVGPKVLATNSEAGYTYYVVGYGLPLKGSNDIIVELVKRPDASFYCDIVKLGSNPIDVYRDTTKMNTIPSFFGVPENTLQLGYMVLTL